MLCKSIIVIEDDEDIRRQVSRALEIEGYEVLQAENGRLALDLLTSLRDEQLPGCMVLDLMMPEMDGKTMIEEIERNHSRLRSIKILVATAKGSPLSPVAIPQALVRIQKPFDLEELYRLVELHCGKPGN